MKQRSKIMHSGDDEFSHFDMASRVKTSEEGEELPLRTKPQQNYIEAQIQEGDTLQAIALRFRCTIAELKRINHVDKDNEIFARRTIKVPISPFSVLTEVLPITPLEPVPSTSRGTPEHNGYTVARLTKSEEEIKDTILNSQIAPIVVPYTDNDGLDNISEDTNLLPEKRHITMEHVVVKQMTSQGADFGIKWYHLLIFILVLGGCAPVIYVLFFLNKHSHTEIDHPPLSDPH